MKFQPMRLICEALDCDHYGDEGCLGGWCEAQKKGIGAPLMLENAGCPFASLLNALPEASEQRIRFATLMLQGEGDMVEEDYPFTEEARRRIPLLGVKQEWHNFVPTQRDKEA